MDSSRYVPPNQVDPTSTRLLRRVAASDEMAWQQVVSLYGPVVLSHSEDAFLAQRTLRIVRKEFRDNTWKAFFRTAIDGQTSRQVAEELNMSPLAVRKAKSRVIQRLKEMLDGPDQAQ